MSRFARLYNGSPSAVDVVLTGPARGRGQSVGFGVSLSPAEVRGAIDNNLIQAVQGRLGFEAEQLVNGVHDVEEWYDRTVPLVRAVHYAAALAAVGGVDAFNDVHRDIVDRRIAEQLRFLRNFADELRVGKQKLNGSVPNRARMYADAAVGTYEVVRRGAFKDAEFQLERRVLDAAAEHCGPCLDYAAMGWQPIGTLPEISATPCSVRCRCTFEYRRDASGMVPMSTPSLPPTLPAVVVVPVIQPPVAPSFLPTFRFPAASPALSVAVEPVAASRFWTAKGSGWMHLDGTRVEKTAGDAFKVISRRGKRLGTFATATAAMRFVERGGKVEAAKELATDASGHEHDAAGLFTGPGALGSAAAAHQAAKDSHRAAKEQFRATRKAVHEEHRGHAQKRLEEAVRHAQRAYDVANKIEFDDQDRPEAEAAYESLDAALHSFIHGDDAPSMRSDLAEAIEAAESLRDAADALPKNKADAEKILEMAKDVRAELKAHAKHRRTMKAIREGNADTIAALNLST